MQKRHDHRTPKFAQHNAPLAAASIRLAALRMSPSPLRLLLSQITRYTKEKLESKSRWIVEAFCLFCLAHKKKKKTHIVRGQKFEYKRLALLFAQLCQFYCLSPPPYFNLRVHTFNYSRATLPPSPPFTCKINSQRVFALRLKSAPLNSDGKCNQSRTKLIIYFFALRSPSLITHV